jgi:hypothetical protein
MQKGELHVCQKRTLSIYSQQYRLKASLDKS